MNALKPFVVSVLGLFAALSTLQAAQIVHYAIDVGKARTVSPQPATFASEYVKAGDLSPFCNGEPSTNPAIGRGPGFFFNFGFLGNLGFTPGMGENYFAFALEIKKGYQIDFNSFSFYYRAPNLNGKKVYWDVRSSADDYRNSLATVTTRVSGGSKGSPGESGYNSGDLPILPLKGISGQITFRVYLYEEEEGTVTGGIGQIGNISVTGTVSPVSTTGAGPKP
ncbi:hypothetical protein H5P28_05250 [Ruficoccus amylovorans]|uniref:Uncharacterized protein n=1 Tax=Ruficoccus amylovorans TaxID=1804625 RepID=A0A842HDP8_9BACT|nr:hypothetical protein [Ruficoccus amylovorans]MBC2593664.1 hypothetical protein [Ruficoccus amylovorans]